MKKLLGTLFTLILVLALAPTALAAKDADDVAYPVEGGNIYIDEATKTVTDADKTVTSVVIPDGITSIGMRAFYICTHLTSVTIPNSVTKIGDYAFDYCMRLPSLTIPESVTDIGKGAFYRCSSLTSVNIPSSVTRLKDEVFRSCTSLTSITIPNSITFIDSRAFSGCSSLTNVTIPTSVTGIQYAAFSNCTSLTSITIPNSVTSLGGSVFAGCSNLTNVTIPNGVTYIGMSAFSSCTSLTSVTIPDSVTGIGENAFGYCTSLTGVTVSGGNKSFVTKDGVLFTANGETLLFYPAGKPDRSYVIPKGVAKINDEAFSGCVNLTSITIPDGVTYIGTFAFVDCTNLSSLTIPNGVTIIDTRAFKRCSSMTSIYIPASITRMGTEPDLSFVDCDSLTDIYYGGTEAQWVALKGPRSGYDTKTVTVHYNAAGLPASAVGFTDLEFWSEDAVHWAVDNKFADARSVSVFGSDDACPRWEVVSILWKAMGSPEPTIASVPFTDVSPSAPYYKAVLWAYEQHITNGTSPTTFGPNDTVLRCDAMTFIYRAAKEPAVTASGSFKDVPAGQYFSAPITWAYKTGISNGTTPTTFSPNDPVTRAQMVTFLYRWAILK